MRNALIVCLIAAVATLSAGCGAEPPADATAVPTPHTTPEPPPPTPGAVEPLTFSCIATLAYALELIAAVAGEDRLPTAFDAINTGGCEFSKPVTSVLYELALDGVVVQLVKIPLTPGVLNLGAPFQPEIDVPLVDERLLPGRYDRRISVFADDGDMARLDRYEPVNVLRVRGSVRSKLLRAESRWVRSGITDYVYETAWRCFCPPAYTAPVLVTVFDGKVTSVAFADPAAGSREVPDPQRFRTVEGLFDFLDEALDANAVRVDAEFHMELGYPLSGYVDRSAMIADEEMGFSAAELMPTR